jgi:hypothetical protein
MQALEAARKCIHAGENVFAPVAFLRFFQSVLPYRLINEDSLSNAKWLILEKSAAANISSKILQEIRQRWSPIFANEVFVIFSNGPSRSQFDFDPKHLQELWVKMTERESTRPKEAPGEKAPSFAAVVTTYNRPWALARSLPQVARLGCPVVVVNDGSGLQYEAAYRRIQDQFAPAGVYWINLPENRGVCCAINIGVSYFLADRSIDWISYFQDDVDVHPDIFKYLAKVQDRTERPLVTGRYVLGHPVVAEADFNGIHTLFYHSIPGHHMHAHSDYWHGVMPLPSFEIGLPKPLRGSSGCDGWIGSWAPNSVCKTGKKIACIPRLVSTFAINPEQSTWGNSPIADDGLLPAQPSGTTVPNMVDSIAP